MSASHHIIKITPPAFIRVGDMIERISGGSHPCSCCHGNGFFWGEDHAERVKVDCPVCKGSGQLDAMITIEWKPCI